MVKKPLLLQGIFVGLLYHKGDKRMNSSIREDHLMIRKFEDPYKLMIYFSTPIDDIVELKDEVGILFRLYRENYDNLDSIIESLFDATKPTIDCGEQKQLDEHYRFTDKKFSYKTVTPKLVELSCPTCTGKEGCGTNRIMHKLSVSYPEGEDFVLVHICAKRY